jgi:hypothetical protein
MGAYTMPCGHKLLLTVILVAAAGTGLPISERPRARKRSGPQTTWWGLLLATFGSPPRGRTC